MAKSTLTPTLDALFPPPFQSGINFSLTQNPGISAEAGNMLVRLLKDNYEKYHIFFNEKGFHNHATHHLFAIYALGAPPSLLEAAYATHTVYQRNVADSPEEITSDNWKDHFGDEKYYRSYANFFAEAVLENGIGPTIETYLFAPEANWEVKKAHKDQPKMFNRLFSGLLHPFIHVAHATEFETPGMIAEGLAMACITPTDTDALIPQELFTPQGDSALSALTSTPSRQSPAAKSKGTHSFTLVARMLEDPALAPGVACAGAARGEGPYFETLENTGALIQKYGAEWCVDGTDAESVREKVEELSWLITLLYGVGGLQPDKAFHADFYTMHLVTSSLFLHSFLKFLSAYAQSLFLRTYLTYTLAIWVSRGRPALSVSNLYAHASAHPSPPAPASPPVPDPSTLDPAHPTPNPWLPLLQTTLTHRNEHFPKVQRALARFASTYGTASTGRFATTELAGAAQLDGTLFARVAGLTANHIGWTRDGQQPGEWEYSGFWV